MHEKNHYIPVFYLKRWQGGNDGRLSVYFRHARGCAVARRHPAGIGYKIDLYTLPGVDLGVATYLERDFFRVTDDLAAKSLAAIESRAWLMDVHVRSGWSRFVTSLLHRNPELIQRSLRTVSRYIDICRPLYERSYLEKRNANHPPTFEGFWNSIRPQVLAETWINLVQISIDNPKIGTFFNQLTWRVFEVGGAYTFLTGDRPIIMTNGMAHPDSHLAIPIGPRRLFVAAADPNIHESIRKRDPDKLVSFVNDLIVRQAREFCIGVDSSQLRFFSNRYGEAFTGNPIDGMPWPSDDELRENFIKEDARRWARDK